MDIYQQIIKNSKEKKTGLAILIDPDKMESNKLSKTIESINNNEVDYIFVGGSLVSSNIDEFIVSIKKQTNKPVILFPGSVLQVSKHVDALLFLSLISGRNPEYLIGNQVIAAPIIKSYGIESISIGYILIENGNVTSVEYMSNSKPIPRNKTDIAVATAIAGEMLGHKLLYLECGSGANEPIPVNMLEKVRSEVSIPLIVGGGIKSPSQAKILKEAGADILVLGTIIEENPEFIKEFIDILN